MAWVKPQFSIEEVDAAGRALVDSDEEPHLSRDEVLTIVNNWRSSHAFPLNTLQVSLRNKASEIDGAYLVAQRIKRLQSIRDKLERLTRLSLSDIQDIGGCRAVLRTVEAVEELAQSLTNGRIKHELVKDDNYIQKPKNSGYRGHHLVFGYRGTSNKTYDGRKIEIQLRSRLQHAWATAVETVSTFTDQSLKSSRGDRDWLRLFELMGSAFARKERRPLVKNTPEDRVVLKEEVRHYVNKLDVVHHLRSYRDTLGIMEANPSLKNVRYFLLELEPARHTTTITSFVSANLVAATNEYLEAEQRMQEVPGGNAVLVSAGSLDALKRAFPNYFLDTNRFLEEVERIIAK